MRAEAIAREMLFARSPVYSRWTAKLALDVARQTLEETLGRRLEDGQREDLSVQVQGDVAAQFFGKVLEDLRWQNQFVCRRRVGGGCC